MEIKSKKPVYFGMALLLVIMMTGISSADPVNVELVSHFSGIYSDVAVNGNYMYLLQDQDLVVVDIEDPSDPAEVGRIRTPSTAYDIAVTGNYAYVAEGESGLMIIDIGNPAAPAIKGSYAASEQARYVYVSGKYAYIADDGLVVLDISDPAAPVLAGRYEIQGDTNDVTVSGKYAYLLISDYTDKSQDALIDLMVLDISDPAAIKYMGDHGYRNNDEYMSEVAVSGNYAYVTVGSQLINYGGLTIFDIRDPASPKVVAGYDVPNPDDIFVLDDHAYVTGGHGLSIIDISDPLAPTIAGSYEDGSWGPDVAASGSYIYLAGDADDLAILHISADPGTGSPSPSPSITSVDIEPVAGVNEGDTATITVSVINDGGPSNEGYISVSFPNNEEVIEVSGTGNEYNKLFPIGSTIYGRIGSMTATDPVAGLSESSWATGQTESLTIKVKPNSGSSKIEFYVRASLKDASGNNVRIPASSANTDQQGWYVDVYSIDVHSITDVAAPASVQNLQQSEVDPTRIKWIWTNPSDSDFSHVMVHIDNAFVTNTSENYYELTGLTEGTTHTIGLKTVDTKDNINPEAVSNEATTSSIIPEITSVSETAITTNSITLGWETSSDTAKVQIFRNNLLITDVNGSTSYVDSNLESDTTYSYTLVPYNNAGLEGNAVTINLRTSSSNSNGGGSSGSISSSKSSSSGGGGGGAGSVEDYLNVAVKDVDRQYLAMDSNVLYEFSREGNDIRSISLYSLKNSGEITSTIEVLNGRSKLVTGEPEGFVYKYINIWVGKAGFATTSNIQDAKIQFKVDSSWLQTMDLSPEDVRLQVYNEDTWKMLQTTPQSTTSTDVIFEAQTTAFGPFAITAEKTYPSPETDITDTGTYTPATGSEDVGMEETPAERTNIWTFFKAFILLGMVAVGYMYLKKD